MEFSSGCIRKKICSFVHGLHTLRTLLSQFRAVVWYIFIFTHLHTFCIGECDKFTCSRPRHRHGHTLQLPVLHNILQIHIQWSCKYSLYGIQSIVRTVPSIKYIHDIGLAEFSSVRPHPKMHCVKLQHWSAAHDHKNNIIFQEPIVTDCVLFI